MILPTHTQRDIRNEVMADALKELRPASFLVAAIAERAHLAAEMERIGKRIDALDRYLDTYEPRRADAPGAPTDHDRIDRAIDQAMGATSPAGSDAVAIPAFLHPQPSEAGLPEVTASGPHSPETATKSTAARKDVPNVEADTFPASHTHPQVVRQDPGGRDAVTAGTQAPPVDTNTENAPDPAQAGEVTSTASPAPNQEPGWVQPEVTAPVRVSDPIKARVLRLRSMRPTWTAGMIAKDLGLTREMVEAALAKIAEREEA